MDIRPRFGMDGPKGQENLTTWWPRFEFEVQGPIEAGDHISISFFKQEGSPWFTKQLITKECTADRYNSYKWDPNGDDSSTEKPGVKTTGAHTFKIALTNALTGKAVVLYTGRFSVVRIPGLKPEDKNACEYYVDNDWMIPIGYLFNDMGSRDSSKDRPVLAVKMWFGGDVPRGSVQAYVYRDGKLISGTEKTARYPEGYVIAGEKIEPEFRLAPRWTSVRLRFENIFFQYKDPNHQPNPDAVVLVVPAQRRVSFTVTWTRAVSLRILSGPNSRLWKTESSLVTGRTRRIRLSCISSKVR